MIPDPSIITAGDLPIAVRDTGAGRPLVLLHGFPETSYSWRHLFAPLSSAGWRVIAPDLRGFGQTGPQGSPIAYSLRNLSADIIAMLDAMDIDRAVVAGHDFGGALAWTLARDCPRIAGIISLNTPYTRRGSEDLVTTIRRYRGPTNYMVTFQEPGVGEAILERDVAAMFSALMRRPALSLPAFKACSARLQALPATIFTGEPALMGAPLLSDADLEFYVQSFKRTGFAGGLNWYRNLHQNWLDTAGSEDRVFIPALMVSAADDFFLPPATTRGMESIVADLEHVTIDKCGHWTMQERPKETAATMLDWLTRRMEPLFQMTESKEG